MLSIIIPVYNEENTVLPLLSYLQKHTTSKNAEIIVVDGQSTDDTFQTVEVAGFKIVTSLKKGRASQMNKGAVISRGDILYFVHADSYPPESFVDDILLARNQGYKAGCYRFRFNSANPLLKINSYFTRFDRIMCRGGDQTLFMTRELFNELDGFKESYKIMEDFDMIERIQERASFKIIPKEAIVSARKYKDNNYLKVNFINFVIFMMYFWGASQETMVHAYKSLIQKTKFG